MTKRSAGVLLWKRDRAGVRVLLVHPGGPFWAKKDDGAWSIPKGEFAEGEDALAVARRELVEELGPAAATFSDRPESAFTLLGASQNSCQPASLCDRHHGTNWRPLTFCRTAELL
jgi:predicted NUDIX family NTP pyrophosphohydrolase